MRIQAIVVLTLAAFLLELFTIDGQSLRRCLRLGLGDRVMSNFHRLFDSCRAGGLLLGP